MRIAFILRSMTVSGGGERQAIMLARTIRRRGHDVAFYTLAVDPAHCFPADIADVSVRALCGTGDPHFPFPRLRRVPLLGGIVAYLRDGRLARALARLIPPDVDILHPNDHWGARVAAYTKRRAPHARAILMLNDLDTARWSLSVDSLSGSVPRRKGAVVGLVRAVTDAWERLGVMRHVDEIAVLNERTRDLVRTYLRREARVVRSGVDAERFPFRSRRPPISGESFRLVAQGIWYPHRRYEDLVEAVRLLRDQGVEVDLEIIGTWEQKQSARDYHARITALARERGVAGQVHFLGAVSDDHLVAAYAKAHAFVSATHMQTWGLAVFEAGASGLPLAISRTIGAAEVLRDGETALFTEPGDPASIAAAVGRLAADSTLAERLGRQVADFVRANLSWEKYADEMLDLFERPTGE